MTFIVYFDDLCSYLTKLPHYDFPAMFKPRGMRNVSKDNGVFHVVACCYDFQKDMRWCIRIWEWQSEEETKHEHNKTWIHYLVHEHFWNSSSQAVVCF